MSDTFDKVKQVLVGFHFNAESATEATALEADLGLDSLDICEITMALEDQLAVEINDDDAANAVTVGDLVKVVDLARKAVA